MKEKLEEMVRRHGYAPKYQVEVMGRKVDGGYLQNNLHVLAYLQGGLV